jgi:hypothetical protein
MSALTKPAENGFTRSSESLTICMFCVLSMWAPTPAILELEESDHCEVCPVYPRRPSTRFRERHPYSELGPGSPVGGVGSR